MKNDLLPNPLASVYAAEAERLLQLRDQQGPTSDTPVAKMLRAACQALIQHKDELNELDSRVGDGDTGTQMALGARAILDAEPPTGNLADLCMLLSKTLAKSMGGSSGVLLSIFFSTMAGSLQRAPGEVVGAFRAGVQQMMEYGGAKLGDRTMLDA